MASFDNHPIASPCICVVEDLRGFIAFNTLPFVALYVLNKTLTLFRKQVVLVLIPMCGLVVAGFFFSSIVPIAKIIAMVPFHIAPLMSVLGSLPTKYLIYCGLTAEHVVVRIGSILLFVGYFFQGLDWHVSKAEAGVLLLTVVGIGMEAESCLPRAHRFRLLWIYPSLRISRYDSREYSLQRSCA